MYNRLGNLRAWRGDVPLSPQEKEVQELRARAKRMSQEQEKADVSTDLWTSTPAYFHDVL